MEGITNELIWLLWRDDCPRTLWPGYERQSTSWWPQNFLTYAKQELDYDTAKVFNSDALLRFVNQEQVVPGENEAYIIGFSTQLHPTYYAKFFCGYVR